MWGNEWRGDRGESSREAPASPFAPGGAAAGSGTRGTGTDDSEPALVGGTNASQNDVMVPVRLDKLLAAAGLATSVSDGSRKVKQNAAKEGRQVDERPRSVRETLLGVHAPPGEQDGVGERGGLKHPNAVFLGFILSG